MIYYPKQGPQKIFIPSSSSLPSIFNLYNPVKPSMLKSLHLLPSTFPLSISHHNPSLFHSQSSLSALSAQSRWLRGRLFAASQEPAAVLQEDGPIELPQSTSIFATDDDPTPLQLSTSVLLTGAVAVFLFRSIRRRAKRAKELQFRSSGAQKSLKDEALESLKAMRSAPVVDDKAAKTSPVQALLGSIAAGVIALILYKFTLTIEAALNRQTVSDSFSVRQITITIRTIVNGLCYLATFVFGINSVGLFLYAGQLALNSPVEDSANKENVSEGEDKLGSSVAESSLDGKEDQSSDDKQ